jgi:D-arabinose 1-dehydrogenase-like Zn-dependent alcohol dehydrogenase
VGEITEVGSAVRSRKVGDRVGVTWVQDVCGRCSYCLLHKPISGQAAVNCAAPVTTGFNAQGGQAEYVAVEAPGTILLPANVAFELAAPMMCAGYTAWSAFRAADPQPGQRVAILGLGGLGHMAVQFAKAAGFETAVITHSPDKETLARDLGADLVVANGKDLKEAGGADVILMTSNSSAAASESLWGLRPDGRMVVAGISLEDFVIPSPFKSGYAFFNQRHHIIGATHNGFQYLREALNVMAAGKVKPMIQVFTKEDVADAYDHVLNGTVRFRAVVQY